MTSEELNRYKQAQKMVQEYQEGDILKFLELEEVYNRFAEKYPDFAALPQHKTISKKLKKFNTIKNQKQFLLESMTEIDKFLARKFPETNELMTPDEEKKCYDPDYFDNITENPEILETFYIEVKEQLEKAQVLLLDLEHDPNDVDHLNTLFRVFHTIKGSSGFLGLRNFEEISHEAEEILTKLRDGSMVITQELADILFYAIVFFQEMLDVLPVCKYKKEKVIENFQTISIFSLKNLLQKIRLRSKTKKIGEILIEMGKTSPQMISRILLKQKENPDKKFGEIAVEEGAIKPEDIKEASNKQIIESRALSSYVKVSSSRLNDLVNMVGELVVTQSILREDTTTRKTNELHRLVTITSEIKDLVLNMGMVPISDIFNRLRVAIRNVARETGKTVTVEIEGENTELDRNLIEAIYDPLLHIVRNSVDHGIEKTKVREKSGKPAIGKITLSAKHSGNGIIISVFDDGAGIDTNKVLEKAKSTKLIDDKEFKRLSRNPDEAVKLILRPGFSTKKEVTEISGRGVGMDIVQKNIAEIQGRLEINNDPGNGAEFQIKLPLTLAIIDGFVVSSRNNKFIFPFNAIDEIIVPQNEHYKIMEDGKRYYLHKGSFVRIIESSDLLMNSTEKGDSKSIVFLNHENKLLGVAVEELLGKQEIVIKKMNELLQHMKLFSGGTIFGDGSIGFIIDLEILFSTIQVHKEAS